MFDFSLFTLAFILLWVFLLVLFFIFDSSLVIKKLKNKMVGILGFILIFSGYFFQPWVELNFMKDILVIEKVEEIIPEQTMEILLEKVDIEWAIKAVRIFGELVSYNGWKIQLIPILSIWARIISLIPLLFSLTFIGWVVLSLIIKNQGFTSVIGMIYFFISLFILSLLLLSFPYFDTLGLEQDISIRIIRAILGVEMGNGPWITCFGLGALAVSGMISWRFEGYQLKSVGEEEW